MGVREQEVQMETFTTKSHVAGSLARLYEAQDELRELGTTIAAVDPKGAWYDVAVGATQQAIAALKKLQDSVAEEVSA